MSANHRRKRDRHLLSTIWCRSSCTFLLCLSAACGRADEPPEMRQARDTPPRLAVSVADTAIVRCGDSNFRIEPQFTLAPADAPSPLDVGLGPDGSLYVLDRAARQVRQFGPDGSQTAILDPSRHGHYLSRGPLGLAVSGSGEVFVWDPHQQMMLVYPADGVDPHAFTVLGQSYGLPARVEATETGDVVVFVVHPAGDRVQETARVYNARGEPGDSLGPFPITTSIAVERRGMRSSVTLPLDLSHRKVLSLAPGGGFLVADSRVYDVAEVHGRDTLWRTARDVPPVRPTSADVRNALALAPSGIGRRSMRKLLPETKSPVVELLASQEWVLVRRPVPSAYTSPALYDLYRSGTTTPCATVEFPPRLLTIRGDLLAGINYEAPERPVVEVYSLTREIER
jgi:hypothetical protein